MSCFSLPFYVHFAFRSLFCLAGTRDVRFARRLLAVRLFSYNPSNSSLSQRDCKARRGIRTRREKTFSSRAYAPRGGTRDFK